MPRPRSEEARQSVLEAMRRALAAHGYEAVTIEGLAEAAEVSKQTIYRWWPSKAAILGEALLEGGLPGAEVSVPVTADLGADLRAWFSAMSAALADPEGVAVARALIVVTASDPELGLALNEKLAAPIREWVAGRVARAVEAGDVRADVDAAAIADQFVAMASYAALLGRPLSDERVDATVAVLLRGITAHSVG
ncbi:TetR/AcrR family transcriptional regulator [Microbacterium aurugineum]|uniref:TetR/AcrR family transcriptional regulator n=1 Tax=Microbacterium aurugineum TaxID=2851642 RepID=UPI0020C09EC3|nr:TetR/AcrR family transcriptional regulator [Microbacterium aurugineum]MCK8476022.1 TetR/AcrR family transcriptional regulator [Microbacterium aurugineum]